MSKQSQQTMVLILNKNNDAFWVGGVKNFCGSSSTETLNWVVVTVPIRSYTLLDHQFVQTKLVLLGDKGEAEVSMLIPRSLVLTIIDAKTGFDVAGFGKQATRGLK